MRVKITETKLYTYDELSDEAKQKTLESLWYINVDHEWWEFVYEDARTIGLKITEFDLDRSKHCKGNLLESVGEVCRRIIENHGKDCATYKLALRYFKGEYSKDGEENVNNFLHDLCEEYISILQTECDYLTSKESILETIEANEYEFSEDGKLGG